MNWFDLLLLGLVLVYTGSGYARGLVKQLFSLFGFLIALVLAFIGSRMFSGIVAGYLDPESIVPYQEALQFLGAETMVQQALELVAGIVTFLVLFVLLLIVIRFFSGGFKWVNRLPVIGMLNRVGGGIIGLVLGVLFAYLLLSVAPLVPLQWSMEAVQGSRLAFLAEAHLPQATAAIKNFILNYYLDTVINNGGA